MTLVELARLVLQMRSAQVTGHRKTREFEHAVDLAIQKILDDNATKIAAEGEKAFLEGGQAWAEWNMANNPFGD